MKKTRAGDGSYLKMTFQVCDGTSKICVFQMYNISNPKPKCVEIGRRQLSGLTKAIGLAKVDLKNPKVFEGHKVLCEVYIKKGVGEYNGTPNPDKNEISAYQSKDAKAAEPATQEAQQGEFTDKGNTPF